MPKKVIYSACSLPAWVDMAVKLYSEAGWAPCYWVGRSQVEGMVKKVFPEAVFHDHVDALNGIPPAECRDLNLPPLDSNLLLRLSPYESIALKMMDRIDYAGQLTLTDRCRLYYSLLRYWLAVLERYRPDIMFNTSTPHQIYDYILYILCKERGIQTILMGIAFDLQLVFCKANYEDGSGNIAAIYQHKLKSGVGRRPIALSPQSEASLRKAAGFYSEAIPSLVSSQLEVNRRASTGSIAGNVAGHFGSYARHVAVAISCYFSKKDGQIKRAEKAQFELKKLLYQDVFGLLRLNRLQRYYEALAKTVELNRPFVYVPLAYQPELSSSPEGDFYVEQSLMVNLLSEAIPSGWLIYVKEHPIQFTRTLGTNRCVRSYDFYDDLVALPNVRLASFSNSPFDLIDHAQVVATVTGTSGWEALVRGKPVMYFGYPWWQGCEGSFYTPNLAACRDVIGKLQAGYRIDAEKLRLFIQVAEQESCIGELYTNRDIQPFSSKQNARIAELSQEMARLILRFYRSDQSVGKYQKRQKIR